MLLDTTPLKEPYHLETHFVTGSNITSERLEILRKKLLKNILKSKKYMQKMKINRKTFFLETVDNSACDARFLGVPVITLILNDLFIDDMHLFYRQTEPCTNSPANHRNTLDWCSP